MNLAFFREIFNFHFVISILKQTAEVVTAPQKRSAATHLTPARSQDDGIGGFDINTSFILATRLTLEPRSPTSLKTKLHLHSPRKTGLISSNLAWTPSQNYLH